MESINYICKCSGQIRRSTRSLLVFSLFTAISSGMAVTAQAQTFAEWFQQNKTQKKYLLQQIAALQAFSNYLKKGYQVASIGLGSISGSLKSENELHTTYYNRLETVDPMVKNNKMVRDIMAWQQDILTQLAGIDQTTGMTSEEKNYLNSVRAAVLKDCDNQINALQAVVTDDKLEMSDAERIGFINKIHAAMLDNYRFASGFAAQVKLYAARRQQEGNQVALAKRLYGIN
ncbi:MAG: hypothetical protein V4577_07460 [Bacteroidota bacterium]